MSQPIYSFYDHERGEVYFDSYGEAKAAAQLCADRRPHIKRHFLRKDMSRRALAVACLNEANFDGSADTPFHQTRRAGRRTVPI